MTVVARRHERSKGSRLRSLSFVRNDSASSGGSHFSRMKAKLAVLDHGGPILATDVPDGDCVIATWWETAFEAVHLPQSKGTKIYFVQGHEVFDHLPKHISAASYLLPLKKITVASWLADKMRDNYGDGDVIVVPNAVDHSLFFASRRGRQAVPTVGLIYSTAFLKGFDVAKRAIEIAREACSEIRVVAFGAASPTRHLPLVRGTRYHRDPPQESIRDIYATCDAFLMPSRSEGFGLPILEAMACRTPVVASRTGCAEDVIRNGENGFIVDVEDAHRMADRLLRILSMDPQSWQLMSDRAYETAGGYNWDHAGRYFEEALYRYRCRQ